MTLPTIAAATQETSEFTYLLVNTEEQLRDLCEKMQAADLIAVDTETEGLAYEDIVVGVCIAVDDKTGYYIPVRHNGGHPGRLCENQLPAPYVFDALRPILEMKPCVGHNVKFDDKALLKEGIKCKFVVDTLALAKLYGDFQSNGLKYLADKILNHKMLELESLFPRKGNKKPIIAPASLRPEEIGDYASDDSIQTLRLCRYFMAKMPAAFKDNLFRVEMRLLPAVAEMEMFGLPVSKAFLEEQGAIARELIVRLEAEITEDIRATLNDPEYKINLGSPPQLAKLLFEDIGLHCEQWMRSKTTGKPGTSKEVLEALAEQNPVARSILTHRTLKKLNNTYLEGLVPKISSDLRIRGNFNQFGTESGRFSSSDPNLQNLPRNQTFYLWGANSDEQAMLLAEFPDTLRQNENGSWEVYDAQKEKWAKRGELGKASDGELWGVEDNRVKRMWKCKTRNFVAAPPGYYLAEADYSQVELRVMAGESQEPTLLKAYATGDDVHSATAAMVFDVPLCNNPSCDSPGEIEHPFCRLKKEQRQSGKTINFSLLYGAGADNIGKQLGISTDEAQELVNRYFERLPNIGQWIDSVRAQATKVGFNKTPFGRIRRYQNIRGRDRKMVAKEQREAGNFAIQGAAADVLKFAFVRTARYLREYFGDDARIVSTVHDSILVEIADHISPDDIARVLAFTMTEPAFLGAIQCRSLACAEAGRHKLAPNCKVKWPELEIDIKVGKAWADAKEISFPEDMTLPEPYPDKESLPKVRVQQVASQRDLGISSSDEVVDVFSHIAVDDGPAQDVAWIIETPNALNQVQVNGLMEFLRERADENGTGKLTLYLPTADGTVEEKKLKGRYTLSLTDYTALRIKVGVCTLRQELSSIDPSEVLRGADFGI